MIKFKTPHEKRRFFIDYAQILVGCVIGALSYPWFLIPNSIAPGGVTGLATILHYFIRLPIGMTSLIFNIPLFLFGWRYMGRRFVYRTFIATILFSVLIDILKPTPITADPLMASVFGGVVLGFGLALILRGGATTGGTDMLARMVHRRFPFVSVGIFLFAFDFIVILMAGFTMSAEHAMHAMISVYLSSKALDTILSGIGTDKACYIISSAHESISQRIMDEMQRGITILSAKGGYSKQDINMLLCVVGRTEVSLLKSIVQDEDEQAFLFITETHETLGEGFHALKPENN